MALFVIIYYVSFLWIDDKRKTYVKSESMYPEMNNYPSPIKSDGLFAQASPSPMSAKFQKAIENEEI